MSEFKKGDWVLVESEVRTECGDFVDVGMSHGTTTVNSVHPHPGVDVEALLEELAAADAIINGPKAPLAVQSLYSRLRDARLAANKPKEVWVRMVENKGPYGSSHKYRHALDGAEVLASPHPDDIKEG